MNYTDLKTFEDACKVLSLDPEKVVPDFSCYPEQDRKALEAHAKLVLVARAANKLANDGDEWAPDWNNGQWDKWHPWFDLDGGSPGFRFNDSVHWASGSAVGSRLCFISEEVTDYIAQQFIDLYRDYFVK
jgi:hypothetical protein